MASPDKVSLLSNAAATGLDTHWRGGPAAFIAEATWGGGTVKLQVKSDQGTYIDVPSASLTANGMVSPLYLPAGQYRANVATATAVYASLVRSPIV